MQLVIYTAPTVEPVSLAELKVHLRLDSETFAGDITTYQSILPGSHAIANNYTTHVGTGVDVLGKTAIVNLNAGTVGAGGTVDAKIQESDDNITYTDVTSGAFTQVDATNDNTIQEKAYTGSKQYIRAVAKVLVAACEFGVDIVVNAATTADDDLLTAIIQAAREWVEDYTRRALITQTWDYYLDSWPDTDYIRLPFGNLSSVTSVSWKDTDGTETTLTVTTDYLVETNGEGYGRIVLPYGDDWPTGDLYPSNPIKIRYICGYGAAATNLPRQVVTAVKFKAESLYEHGDRGEVLENTAKGLLSSYRMWSEF